MAVPASKPFVFCVRDSEALAASRLMNEPSQSRRKEARGDRKWREEGLRMAGGMLCLLIRSSVNSSLSSRNSSLPSLLPHPPPLRSSVVGPTSESVRY